MSITSLANLAPKLEPDEYATAIFSIHEATGWVGTNQGNIYKTSNGGATWRKVNKRAADGPIQTFRIGSFQLVAEGVGVQLSSNKDGEHWQ